jgi:hypothetical protein
LLFVGSLRASRDPNRDQAIDDRCGSRDRIHQKDGIVGRRLRGPRGRATPLLTTRLIARAQLAIGPELERSLRRVLAERSAEGASLSERTAKHLAHTNEPAHV